MGDTGDFHHKALGHGGLITPNRLNGSLEAHEEGGQVGLAVI